MALVYQISLHGTAFDARNLSWSDAVAKSGCLPNLKWIDPLHKRPLNKGEFGCAVSHRAIWQKIASSKQNGIILEEDAIFDAIDVDDVDAVLAKHDSAWLGYRFNEMGYWYNCHAYALTPQSAQHLLTGYEDQIIPVDEWVPLRLADKKNYFYSPEIVKQIPRSVRPSTIEDTPMLEGKDTDFRIITVATEPEKMWALEQSASRYGVDVVNIGLEHPWRDPMTGLAGMPKIQLVNEYLSTIPDDAVVLFMDGYDTFFADSPLEVLKRYREMNADIVFGAESECWPLSDDEFMRSRWLDTGTPYKYLNSGLYIGTAKALHAFISQDAPGDDGDDQLFCQLRYLKTLVGAIDKGYSFPYSVVMDVEAYIFQNHEPTIRKVNGQIWNDLTSCCGCIYHGNGGPEAKEFFLQYAAEFGLQAPTKKGPSPYYMKLDYEVVADEIILTDFLTDVQCQYLIDKAEAHGKWGNLDGDKFPAQEIRLKKLGLWHEYERLWSEKLGKIAETYWKPMQHIGLRDAFAMKYTVDTQKSLALHTDASLVTGSVKLNDDFEGAEVVFPRQNFSNSNVARGKCLIWPSQVSHGHYVPDLIKGTKYSLTMWTSRYEGDVND